MKVKFSISVIFLVALFGCVSTPKASETPAIQTPSLTAISTAPILVERPKTPTISTEGTKSLENWEAAKSCIKFLSTRPNDYELSGVLALRSLSSTTLGLRLSLLDLSSGVSKEADTANQSIDDARVSPNRQTLAYTWFNIATSKWELHLINTTGKLPKIGWSSKEGFWFSDWLNDHQLVIKADDTTYIIVDPYQGTQEKIHPLEFPDFDLYNPTRFYVAFDPSLTKAIYKYGEIKLLDLKTKTIISRLADNYDRTPIVAWQPDDKQAAIVASNTSVTKSSGSPVPDEIFIIAENGQVQQLTHLYEFFHRTFEIDNLSWSPDEKDIAFWASDGQGNLNLMMADATTGAVVNYCITSDLFLFSVGLPAPIWSPDGSYLLVEKRYTSNKNDPTQSKSMLLVVDIQNKVAFPIAENENPVGWMLP